MTYSVDGSIDFKTSPFPPHFPSKQAPQFCAPKPRSLRKLCFWKLTNLFRVTCKDIYKILYTIQTPYIKIFLMNFEKTIHNILAQMNQIDILSKICHLNQIFLNRFLNVVLEYYSMRKDCRKYNLALKQQLIQNNTLFQGDMKLNMISQVPQNTSSQEIQVRPINIFELEKLYRNEKLKENNSPYSVICRKQVQAYRIKMNKTKPLGVIGIFRNKISESFLSSSRHTGTFGQLINNNQCLTKDDLNQFYKKSKQTTTITKNKKNSSPKYQSIRQSFSHNNQNFRKARGLPILSRNKVSRHYSIESSKTKVKSSITNSQAIHNHRKKIEELCKYTLQCERENIQPHSWVDNLRNQNPLKSILDHKFTEQIQRQGIKLKGQNKLEKQYHWISERKNQLYEPLDKKSKLMKKSSQASDQSRVINSVIENNQSRITNLNQITI